MYFVELEGVKEGKKIRRTSWENYCFAYFDAVHGVWRDKEHTLICDIEYFNVNGRDWEYYQEPKKKKKIKLYAYGYKSMLDEYVPHVGLIHFSNRLNPNLAKERATQDDMKRIPEFDKEIEVEEA